MTRLFAGTAFDIPPTCDLCGQPLDGCKCTALQKAEAQSAAQRRADRLPPEQQTATVRLEKRKAGRVVTVVAGLTAKANDLSAVLSKLQFVCGAGGTVKSNEDTIELQGDHVAHVVEQLKQIGFRVKPSR